MCVCKRNLYAYCVRCICPSADNSQTIPYATDRSGALHSVLTVSAATATVGVLEHVQVTVNVDATRRGDFAIDLVSPMGTVAPLMTVRPYDDSAEGIHWTFTSVFSWGETPVGDWHLYIRNGYSASDYGRLADWQLTLYGHAPIAVPAKV